MFRLRDEIDLERLTDFDFKVSDLGEYIIATRDRVDDSCKIGQFIRIAVFSEETSQNRKRVFSKSKFRGYPKCALNMSVTKNDIADLIEAGLIERINRTRLKRS